ncbi:hypothetical protein ACEK07_07805 [Alcanivoracaceae bacterium MT1]
MDALFAGMRGGALAYANASTAEVIGAQPWGRLGKGAAHGGRGAFFAAMGGGGGSAIRSGFVGGFTEGVLGGRIYDEFEKAGLDPETNGVLTAALVGGTVSEVTGGKFAVGAATAAMGYLANELQTKYVTGKNGHGGLKEYHTSCASIDCAIYSANEVQGSELNEAWAYGQLMADLEAFSNIAAVIGFVNPVGMGSRLAATFGWGYSFVGVIGGDAAPIAGAITGEVVNRQFVRKGVPRATSGRLGILSSILSTEFLRQSNYVETR